MKYYRRFLQTHYLIGIQTMPLMIEIVFLPLFLVNIDNYVRLFSSSTSYIRCDFLWNFFKTIRHQNRFGPSFSTFNSFALKCSNNILPTGDNLAKRHDQIYDNWNCIFCNRNLETLRHLLNCPALTQQ